jgi:Acetyltransferase (GNAT) family
MGKTIAATLELPTKKPWAIELSYFTPVKTTLYLTDMAVIPAMQREGIGRMLLDEAVKQARAWPVDALPLDAFDAEAGAGAFYAKCGFRKVGRGDVPQGAADLLRIGSLACVSSTPGNPLFSLRVTGKTSHDDAVAV